MRHTGAVGITRRAVTRGLGAIALLGAFACITGCGAKDIVSVNKAMPSETLFTFVLRDISDLDYKVPPEGGIDKGSMQLTVDNSVIASVLIWTRCGSGLAKRLEITADRFVVKEIEDNFDAAKCSPEQLVAAKHVVDVIGSSPRYRYNGERLQLIGEKATVTFALLTTQPLINGNTG